MSSMQMCVHFPLLSRSSMTSLATHATLVLLQFSYITPWMLIIILFFFAHGIILLMKHFSYILLIIVSKVMPWQSWFLSPFGMGINIPRLKCIGMYSLFVMTLNNLQIHCLKAGPLYFMHSAVILSKPGVFAFFNDLITTFNYCSENSFFIMSSSKRFASSSICFILASTCSFT